MIPAGSWSNHGSNVQNLGVAVAGIQAGDLIVVACFLFDSAAKHFDAPTDDAGNTYTLLTPVVWDATNRSICVFAYAKNVAVAGLTTVTGHVNNTTANDVEIQVFRVPGADITAPFDAEAIPTKQTAQNPAPGALTTGNADDLIFVAAAEDGAAVTFTPPTGFSAGILDGPNGYASAYKAVSAIQTAQVYQWFTTGSRDYSMVVAAFKAAAGGVIPAFTTGAATSGVPAVGASVHCDGGVATGAPTPTKTYQWFRETAVSSGVYTTPCTGPGNTSQNYQSIPGDLNLRLVCTVTATNASGSATSTTAPTAAVADHIPGPIRRLIDRRAARLRYFPGSNSMRF